MGQTYYYSINVRKKNVLDVFIKIGNNLIDNGVLSIYFRTDKNNQIIPFIKKNKKFVDCLFVNNKKIKIEDYKSGSKDIVKISFKSKDFINKIPLDKLKNCGLVYNVYTWNGDQKRSGEDDSVQVQLQHNKPEIIFGLYRANPNYPNNLMKEIEKKLNTSLIYNGEAGNFSPKVELDYQPKRTFESYFTSIVITIIIVILIVILMLIYLK